MAKKKSVSKKKSDFKDKVAAISKKLKGTKVPKKYRKDYGATYDKKDATTAANRIVGSMIRNKKKKVVKRKK